MGAVVVMGHHHPLSSAARSSSSGGNAVDVRDGEGGKICSEPTRISENGKSRRLWRCAISFYVNVLLLAVKIFASVQSGSLSIITSALDSFLDLVSGLILYFTDKHMQNMNKYLYPSGRVGCNAPGF